MARVTKQQKIMDSAHGRNFHQRVVAIGNRDWPVHAADHYVKVKLNRNKSEYNKSPNMFR